METVVHIIAIAAGSIVFCYSLLLACEVLAGVIPETGRPKSSETPGLVAILIPAHNEGEIIARTLASVRRQLRTDDKVVVVADNCKDNTAEVARKNGAECVERNDPSRRGKGYALQFGIDALRAAPPDIIVFLDADCFLAPNALERITSLCAGERRPVQGLYLMKAPDNAFAKLRVAEFAWLFINQVRMRGLQRLFDVSRFTGSGLALPWSAVESLSLASGEVVEDLALTLALTDQGMPPLLEPAAEITSEFPMEEGAITRQSARWSVGSMSLAARSGFSWLVKALANKNMQLLGAVLDMLLPPLTIFMLWLFGAALLASASWLLGNFIAATFTGLAIAFTFGSIALGWAAYGRTALPVTEFAGLIKFLSSKVFVFGARGRKSAQTWSPTRQADNDDAAR